MNQTKEFELGRIGAGANVPVIADNWADGVKIEANQQLCMGNGGGHNT